MFSLLLDSLRYGHPLPFEETELAVMLLLTVSRPVEEEELPPLSSPAASMICHLAKRSFWIHMILVHA